MSLVYVDSSAMVKLLADEAESQAFEDYLREVKAQQRGPVASALLEVELSRLAVREGIPRADVDTVVGNVTRLAISQEVIDLASGIEQSLKSLDALHLATALLLADEAEGEDAVDTVVTYDLRMALVAAELGFSVASPGR